MTAAIKANVPWAATLAAFLLGCLLGSGCGGPTPLLTVLSESHPAPAGVGSVWNYQAVSAGSSFSRSITATAVVAGQSAQILTLTASPSGPAQRLSGAMFQDGTGVHLYSTAAAPGLWALERKLPYIVGASWILPAPAGSDSRVVHVEGMETVIVPAGTFERCYRLIETTRDSSAVPNTVENVIWVSPSVGDVKYGHVDANGVIVADYVLGGFTLNP